MSSPKVPDSTPATITLAYKSGQTHIHNTDAADARRRALTAIRRKSVKWIKVQLPNGSILHPKEIRAFYSASTGKWERSIVLLPRTKN